jgi:hypothetical protein
MSKKVILWLSLCASALLVGGLGILIPSLAFFTRWTCQQTPAGGLNCEAAPESLGAGFYTAVALLAVGGILFLSAWIGALVRAARMQDWLWLVILLVGSGIAALVYGIIGPDTYPLTATLQPPVAPPPSERIPMPVGPDRNDTLR